MRCFERRGMGACCSFVLAVIALGLLAGCAANSYPPYDWNNNNNNKAPSAPTALTATAGDSQMALSWGASSGATSYNIYWGYASGVTTANGTKVGSLSGTSYSQTSLTNGLNYYYIVTAVNNVGESAPSSEVSAMPLPAGAIAIPLTPGTATGGHLQVNTAPTDLSFSFDGKEVTCAGTAVISPVAETGLPAPLPSAAAKPSQSKAKVKAKNGRSMIPIGAGCTFVGAFHMTTPAPPPSCTITSLATPATVGGSVTLTQDLVPGTTLDLAVYQNSSWLAAATLVVGATGSLTQNLPSVDVPGVLGPGDYALCQPKGGTIVSNLGLALFADDGNGSGEAADAVQVVKIYDANGNPLATPTISYLAYPGAGDLDGQAMTPDGSQGILVDGGNTIRFFSKVQTGTPVADTYTLAIPSQFGYDGDSIAILPEGDEAVVSADDDAQVLLVSGILSGAAFAGDAIPVPNARDGLVISSDGKVMLARGYSGLTVYSIAESPHAGSLGNGNVAHSFTQVTDLTDLGGDGNYDGREGMAFSPVDSTRAVLISGNGSTVRLLTGLPGTPVAGTTLDASAAGFLYSVAVTPDGKSAVVGGDNGILLISGVDTGNLAIVGSLFSTYKVGTVDTTLGYVSTLGVTLDGKYVVLCDGVNYNLLVVPITTTGFSDPVGLLTNVAVPDNDQMLIH